MSVLNFNYWSLNESTYIPNISDVAIIAATLVGEAGGETYKGMQTIKNVLINRASKNVPNCTKHW